MDFEHGREDLISAVIIAVIHCVPVVVQEICHIFFSSHFNMLAVRSLSLILILIGQILIGSFTVLNIKICVNND